MRAEKILFATDYSESNAHALSLAAMSARASDGLLLIAHVSDAEQHPVGGPS
jgi:nucleotide-binding universal stress UspA family protein